MHKKLPVIIEEMIRGRISILSIRIITSPGKEIRRIVSGLKDHWRATHPMSIPRKTPKTVRTKSRLSFIHIFNQKDRMPFSQKSNLIECTFLLFLGSFSNRLNGLRYETLSLPSLKSATIFGADRFENEEKCLPSDYHQRATRRENQVKKGIIPNYFFDFLHKQTLFV